jgi:hypothetical protein
MDGVLIEHRHFDDHLQALEEPDEGMAQRSSRSEGKREDLCRNVVLPNGASIVGTTPTYRKFSSVIVNPEPLSVETFKSSG